VGDIGEPQLSATTEHHRRRQLFRCYTAGYQRHHSCRPLTDLLRPKKNQLVPFGARSMKNSVHSDLIAVSEIDLAIHDCGNSELHCSASRVTISGRLRTVVEFIG
jgi:hypothetical protein